MKLGIVGTGMIAKEVLPLLRHCGWEPVALCSTPRSAQIAAELCEAHNIPKRYESYPDMLSAGDFDAVYLAVPNHLHAEYALQALRADCHVIVEKPFAGSEKEAEEMAWEARERSLFLLEAISTRYLPGYKKLRELLPCIGEVKLAVCQYCQYSSRYDAFLAGELPPAFDPKKCGGALMDLNLYNLHFIAGLFGAPAHVGYAANLERGIDTSGIVTLQYGSFQAVAIGAKDCASPNCCMIQGTKGYLRQEGAANTGGPVTLHLNDGTEKHWNDPTEHRMIPEFRRFAEMIGQNDLSSCYDALEQSVLVSRIQTEARRQAGIAFPADVLGHEC